MDFPETNCSTATVVYRVAYEDGPCAWNYNEAHVEAEGLDAAMQFFRDKFPKAMIVSAQPLAKTEERPYNTFIA